MEKKEYRPIQMSKEQWAVVNVLNGFFDKFGYQSSGPSEYKKKIIISFTKELQAGEMHPRIHVSLLVSDLPFRHDLSLGAFHIDESRHLSVSTKENNKITQDEIKKMIKELETNETDNERGIILASFLHDLRKIGNTNSQNYIPKEKMNKLSAKKARELKNSLEESELSAEEY